jgi:TolB protein
MDLTPPAVPTAAATKPKPPASAGKIVYTRTDKDVHSLWTMNLDGSGQKKVADYASDPSWSPDGAAIVFFGWDGSPRGGSGIYTIQANGTGPKLIWNQGSASYLDWALSGRWVAMNTIVPDSANRRLVVYDGGEGKWQDIGPGEQPSFSPNASKLVARTCIGGSCGLFVMNRDGSGMARITTSADDAMPAWSPIGNRIAFASQRDGNWDVWVMNTDGSGKTQLTTDPGVDAMPAWLPDGRGLVFRSSRDGAWGIWIMNADGSNPRKIINAPAANDWGRDRLDVR